MENYIYEYPESIDDYIDEEYDDLHSALVDYIRTVKVENKQIEISQYEILKSSHKLSELIKDNYGKADKEIWGKVTTILRKMRKEFIYRLHNIDRTSEKDRVKRFEDAINILRTLDIYYLQFNRKAMKYIEPSFAEFKFRNNERLIHNELSRKTIIKECLYGGMIPEEIGISSVLKLEIDSKIPKQISNGIKEEIPNHISNNIEEISKEQSNEKTLKEISFLKEKIARLETEGRNRNTRILNRLEERLKMITSKIDKPKQSSETESKIPGIFDRKTTEKIERVEKKWGVLDTWIGGDQRLEKNYEEVSKIPEASKIEISEEPIEKWGEATYEESKAAKTESTTSELNDQILKEDDSVVEVEQKIEETTKEENVEEVKSEEQLIEEKKEESITETKPKKRILKIIRRKIINET